MQTRHGISVSGDLLDGARLVIDEYLGIRANPEGALLEYKVLYILGVTGPTSRSLGAE